jgi:N utilization substance protein A
VSEELLRLVDSIHRDKGVDKETLFSAIEEALSAAAKKRFKTEGDVVVQVDRMTGDITASEEGESLSLDGFGRIAARTAYQVMTQRIREAERDVVFGDYEAKLDTLVTGTVQRTERGTIVVNLGRTEGILPRQEQVFNENYRAGDRIRAYILSVKKKGQKVVIILSRTHPNLVKELFALEIPEVSDRIVEIKNIVREPGFRTKVAVASNDARVDPQGACIGVRGSRIRNIVDELSGERIDIIPWNESAEIFIRKALSPAEITAIELDRDSGRARAVVPEDQLSLAIGKRGQNVRLAARLTGWHIDILTEEEAKREKDAMREEMQRLPGEIRDLDQPTLDTLMMSGFSSIHAIAKKGSEALLTVKGMDAMKARELHDYAVRRALEMEEEKARRITEERQRLREEAAAAAAAAAAEAEALAKAVAEGEPAADAEGDAQAEGESEPAAADEAEPDAADEAEPAAEGESEAAAEEDTSTEDTSTEDTSTEDTSADDAPTEEASTEEAPGAEVADEGAAPDGGSEEAGEPATEEPAKKDSAE